MFLCISYLFIYLIILNMLTVQDGGCSNISLESISKGSDWIKGDVLVTYNGQTGAICGKSNKMDAVVVCNQYGYAGGGKVSSNATSNVVMLSSPSCKGPETEIMDCAKSVWKKTTLKDCKSTSVLTVKCYKKYLTSSLRDDVRLVGNGITKAVKISNTLGSWSSICADSWHNYTANVTCIQMGYSSGEAESMDNILGSMVNVPNIKCDGREFQLSSCEISPNTSGCVSKQIAAVACKTENVTEFTARLLLENYEGTLYLFVNGAWSTVCVDWIHEPMMEHIGKIACKQMSNTRLYKAIKQVDDHYSSMRGIWCSKKLANLSMCEYILLAPTDKVFKCKAALYIQCGRQESILVTVLNHIGNSICIPLLICVAWCVNCKYQARLRKNRTAQLGATTDNTTNGQIAPANGVTAPPPATAGLIYPRMPQPPPPYSVATGQQGSVLPPTNSNKYGMTYSQPGTYGFTQGSFSQTYK